MRYIGGPLKDDLRQMVEDGCEAFHPDYVNFSIVTQLQTGAEGSAKSGSLLLTQLMIDKNNSTKNKTTPKYNINQTPKTKSSSLYLIRCSGGCNNSIF